MNATNINITHYDLYEVDEFDPLDDLGREQGFVDPFWTLAETTIQDFCELADPLLH